MGWIVIVMSLCIADTDGDGWVQWPYMSLCHATLHSTRWQKYSTLEWIHAGVWDQITKSGLDRPLITPSTPTHTSTLTADTQGLLLGIHLSRGPYLSQTLSSLNKLYYKCQLSMTAKRFSRGQRIFFAELGIFMNSWCLVVTLTSL